MAVLKKFTLPPHLLFNSSNCLLSLTLTKFHVISIQKNIGFFFWHLSIVLKTIHKIFLMVFSFYCKIILDTDLFGKVICIFLIKGIIKCSVS